jgi:chromosomal replication initiator protein
MNPYVIPGLREVHIPARYFILPSNVTKDQLMNVVCEIFEVEKNQVISKTRKRTFVEARKAFSYFASKKLGYTLSYIGKDILKKRDHSTVIHAIKSCEDLYETDPVFRNKIDRVALKISEIKK